MSEITNEEFKRLSTALVENTIATTDDRAAMLEKLSVTMTNNRVTFLRDLSTTCLALIGGALTILTVDKSIIKSLTLFLVGVSLVGIACVLSFICRSIQNRYLIDVLLAINKDRLAILTPSNEFLIQEGAGDTMEKLSNALGNSIDFKLPNLNNLIEFGDKYIGIVVLVGAIIGVTGLFFHVSV